MQKHRFKIIFPSLAVVFLVTSTHSARAAYDIFETYAVVTINNGGNTYYDVKATTGNPDYQAAYLGGFNPAITSLVLNGGQVKTYKNSGGDVTGTALSYRIYSGAPAGAFTSLNLPWAANLSNPGDQRWEATGANVNVLNNLTIGNYTLEIYFAAFGNEGTKYDNRGGLNYQATFSVVPEPSNVALGLFGFIGGVGGLWRWQRSKVAA